MSPSLTRPRAPHAERVLKYPIEIADTFELRMAPGTRVVHVAAQNGRPFMWAIVPAGDATQERRTFHLRGTGHGVEVGLSYLGTFQLHDGEFIGHLFEPTDGSM